MQGTFLLVWLDPLMLRLHSVCGTVFHCYSCPLATFACPIGVIANFSALWLFPFLAVGLLLLAGALVGALWCGWVCPFGMMQDAIATIPTPKFRLPAWTGYFRYAVLVGLVLAVPFFLGKDHPLFFCSVCPAGALEGAFPTMAQAALAGESVVWPNALKLTILGAVLAVMLFTLRPWCRVLCPLGAIYGLFNRVSFLNLRYSAEDCNDCGLCESECRYGVLPSRSLSDSRCIRCFECTRCRGIDIGTALQGDSEVDSGATTPDKE